MELIKSFEENPWIMALSVIIANIGVQFIQDDLTKNQRDILNNCILRKVYIFALTYCGTKNIMISLIVTLIYSLIISMIPNDDEEE